MSRCTAIDPALPCVAGMELGGTWRAATADDTLRRRFHEPDLSEDDWEDIAVPGHWRSHPAFSDSDGPLFYRRCFETPSGPRAGGGTGG
ncbi:MAG: hypothetical protein FWC87_09275, partial [Acidimicrobiaceae bacterium]|nr:hypothetical protein [Acidimicrobiaceae bacterium]